MKRAKISDRSRIVDLLAAAFEGNKSVNYVVRQDGNRADRIKRLMRYSFNICNKFGEVWISDDQQACALILFTEKKKTTIQTILWDIDLVLTVIGFNRVKAVLKRDEMIKANHPKEAFAYLFFLGVDPEVQGKGSGSSLMREIIDHYDKLKRPIYLETSMEKNLPFYKKLGFEIFSTVQLSYTLYIMRRFSNVPMQ
jgi:ribosomal protein S18 acetylase RimI-like enzyme